MVLFDLLGECLVRKDMNTAWELFQDFALDKFVKLFRLNPQKRIHLVKILYSFCANDAAVHLNVIKSLQEKCLEEALFIQVSFNLYVLQSN